MNKYIRFLYYIYLNKAVIPSSDWEVFEYMLDLRYDHFKVDVKLYAQLTVNELKRINE